MEILAAMSGGVDSTVAALLLLREGHDVVGGTALLFDGADVSAAQKQARDLGIPHHVFDLRKAFRENVMEPFAAIYGRGETPNPCVLCNRTIKFGALLEEALALGCDAVATGHYARLRYDSGSGRQLLLRGVDPAKDQSYFLAGLTQAQLSKILFPLGGLTKPEVRAIAEEAGLTCSSSRESQDICFLPDGDHLTFLRSRLTLTEGDFVDGEGHVLGRHQGLPCYTLGQRRGTGVASDRRLYVVEKRPETNAVVLGDESMLYTTRAWVTDVRYYPFETLTEPLRVAARTRYRQKDAPATLYPAEEGAMLEFDLPQRAVTPGQAAVFYDGDVVVGGGMIRRAK